MLLVVVRVSDSVGSLPSAGSSGSWLGVAVGAGVPVDVPSGPLETDTLLPVVMVVVGATDGEVEVIEAEESGEVEDGGRGSDSQTSPVTVTTL